MVVYKKHPIYDAREERYRKTRQERFDQFRRGYDWTLPGTDYHFMRAEYGCADKYMCVQHYYKQSTIRESIGTPHEITPKPVNPNIYVKRGDPSLCLCKKRPEADKDPNGQKACPSW